MKTTNVEALFSGNAELLGGLSNEAELARNCPAEFKQDNPWSDYAMQLFFRGGKLTNWKWRNTDQGHQRHQLACFRGLISTFGLKHEDKEAVAGWMLSVMLTEVPEYEALAKAEGHEPGEVK